MKQYQEFCNQFFSQQKSIPIKEDIILCFLTQQRSLGYFHITIHLAFSALNYINQMSVNQDMSSNFIIRKCLTGIQKLSSTTDLPLPVTEDMLCDLCKALDKVYPEL
jgi:hypothetical protein